MRSNVKDPRGDARSVDGVNRLGKAGASAGRGRKLRMSKWEKEQAECQQGTTKHKSIHASSPTCACSRVSTTNGHCLITRVQTRNADMPRAISSSPHLRAGPVCQKSHAQPSMVKIAGTGKSHILNGSRSGPQRLCNRITPTA